MPRKAPLVIGLALFLSACTGNPPQSGSAAAEDKKAEDKKSAAEGSPVGAWDITGQDKTKVKYIGTLILTTDKDKLVGHIMWAGTDGSSGREHVTATYDPKGRTLSLKGVKHELPKGISLGTYSAELSADGMTLEKGVMKGSQPIYDGEWSAKRIVFK